MAQVLPIQTPRRGRRRTRHHRRARPVKSQRLVFPTPDGEDQVSVLPASGGGPWVWFQARSVYGESMQNVEVLLDRRQLRAVVRLLARAAHRLDERPDAPADGVEEAYRDELICRAAEEWYEAERGGIELPEDY